MVLDPSKITARTEASESRGFGYPLSSAEEYVIRFPLSDMNQVLNTAGSVTNVSAIDFDGHPALVVSVVGSYTSDSAHFQLPQFEYILSTEMKVIGVKYESETVRFRNELIGKGRMKKQIDQAYLDDLKRRVLYWNGRTWQNEVTMIEQPRIAHTIPLPR
jgi:hypothetical protein